VAQYQFTHIGDDHHDVSIGVCKNPLDIPPLSSQERGRGVRSNFGPARNIQFTTNPLIFQKYKLTFI